MNAYIPHETRLGGRVVLVQYSYRTWFLFTVFHMVSYRWNTCLAYAYLDEAVLLISLTSYLSPHPCFECLIRVVLKLTLTSQA